MNNKKYIEYIFLKEPKELIGFESGVKVYGYDFLNKRNRIQNIKIKEIDKFLEFFDFEDSYFDLNMNQILKDYSTYDDKGKITYIRINNLLKFNSMRNILLRNRKLEKLKNKIKHNVKI